MDFDDHWFLVGYMLSENPRMSVADMASELGIPRPGLARMIEEMITYGLVSIEVDPAEDPVRKLVSLTEEGKETVAALKVVWEAVGDATAELISESHPELLEAIARIENNLDDRSLFSRVSSRIDTCEDRFGKKNSQNPGDQ
jgi:DNA-binding MarR family transcriptional regulator